VGGVVIREKIDWGKKGSNEEILHSRWLILAFLQIWSNSYSFLDEVDLSSGLGLIDSGLVYIIEVEGIWLR
jgi:hypothetical protein